MIPRPYIAKWKDYAPWKQYAQVEQDLIISRILIEVFSDTFLKENLAFRGGTALHKLYLNPAIRYSEDINLVQIKSGPIKPIINRLGGIITFFYEDRRTDIRIHSTRLLYRFISEYEQIRLRLKIEINTREHFHTLPLEHFSLEINNPWYSGKADIRTAVGVYPGGQNSAARDARSATQVPSKRPSRRNLHRFGPKMSVAKLHRRARSA